MIENNLLLDVPSSGKILRRDDRKTDSIFSGRILKRQNLAAEETARNRLLEADRTAIETTEKARAEAEAIRQTAYRAGREEAAEETLENILAAKEQRRDALQSIEQDVLKLSIKIAEKIIGREIASDEKTRGEIVLTALRQARQREMLIVRVNAADLPIVERMRERIEAFGQARYIDFVADQTVGEGGCLIESQSGTIDARLETQLRVFEKALLAKAATEPEAKE